MSSTTSHQRVTKKMSTENQPHLNDSWIELNLQQPMDSSAIAKPSIPPGTIEKRLLEAQKQQMLTTDPTISKPVSYGTMEKLLLEAQREWSRNSSRIGSNVASTASSRSSPKSPRSPVNELVPGVNLADTAIHTIQESEGNVTDWIWDWSSRPEVIPPSEMSGLKHKAGVKRAPLSVRNTKVMHRGVFSVERLPLMLLTHACTFFLGAAVMFVYLKKFSGWSSVLTNALD